MTAPVPPWIDPALLASASAAAAWRGKSLRDYIDAVVRRASEADLALAASLQEAEDSIDRGEFYTQDEMEAWFATRHGQAAAE